MAGGPLQTAMPINIERGGMAACGTNSEVRVCSRVLVRVENRGAACHGNNAMVVCLRVSGKHILAIHSAPAGVSITTALLDSTVPYQTSC